MQNSSSDLLINSKYAIVSIDIYFRIGAQPGTDAPPNYIGRHIVLDREAESIKIDELENIRKDIARTYLLHNAQNDVKKLEAIDEYLHEVYRKAEHSFKSKTGTSFNQTSLNVRLDAIAQYIEDNFDKCIEAAKCAIHISEI